MAPQTISSLYLYSFSIELAQSLSCLVSFTQACSRFFAVPVWATSPLILRQRCLSFALDACLNFFYSQRCFPVPLKREMTEPSQLNSNAFLQPRKSRLCGRARRLDRLQKLQIVRLRVPITHQHSRFHDLISDFLNFSSDELIVLDLVSISLQTRET